MTAFMKKFTGETHALMRIVTGFLFLWHGSQKLFGFPVAAPDAPAFIIYITGPIELICGVCVMIGLFTRWAAFLCSGLMAFAYWLGHGTKGLLPLLNGGELAALYCFVFLFLAAHGAGIWSVDAARGKSAARRPAKKVLDKRMLSGNPMERTKSAQALEPPRLSGCRAVQGNLLRVGVRRGNDASC